MATNTAATTAGKHQLHTQRLLRRTYFNRAFAVVYSLALLALLYRQALSLVGPISLASISMLIADLVLVFVWIASQACRMKLISREVYVENLHKVITSKEDFLGLDIFICTADPFKEPPLNVVNTALSVMAYDYPPEKLSVYVSDDGGSELTLFAFMEAAKFGRFWLPFCKRNNVMDRCPDAYFKLNYSPSPEAQTIKDMYEKMRMKIESVMEKGKVTDEYITSEEELQAFSQWKDGIFTRQQHPSVIQVLLEGSKDKDIEGNPMPNLVYISREKSKASPHHFKAGALNTLLRVSAVMTNAPIILTLDCDMYSNDPKTAQRVLCFIMDPPYPKLGYIQFPQIYHGLNKADTYAAELRQIFQINPMGLDGIRHVNYVGTGCFFNRRVFFGGPSSLIPLEIQELRPDYVVKQPIKSEQVMNLAHQVAGCNYDEDHTDWGSKIGLKYGSVVEDFYTGYRLQCEGWHSIFYHPKRPAFLGDVPISLHDSLSQNKRWAVGLLEVGLSKYSPVTFGVKAMGIFAASTYAHYALWPIWSIPITIYAFIPQLSMLNNIPVFPKVSDPWFFLYSFLFLGAYGQQLLDFILSQSTIGRWWSDQRFWLLRGLTSHLFATFEVLTKSLGINIATQGFNVTSKVIDDEQGKRYDQGIFEFGVASPMFVPMSMAAILNLVASIYGFLVINFDGFFAQMFLAGFGVLNSLPILEAMILRSDKGRMPTKVTIISAFLVLVIYGASLLVL
ncbi:OLC1v1028944C1 [Oldenlandia corymbosa var. corymbosa]|uniref:OLC1v1028944C1 n=1 Tax=Oldenlandia corymbosa var. corymbosa TaxID=529605 RepID=A0AAV1CDB4_OLDCO|nr:OLC1v1028944C1 [Oldenlandia corymbosa var. corymbosa]